MSLCAKITVTSGPDRGRVFELTGEMMRLGKAPENEVALTDSQLGDLHASIVRREGRFAIFTALPEGLDIDGTEVPPERWVWLPESATIRVGSRTSVEFVVNGEGNLAPAPTPSSEKQLTAAPADPSTRAPGPVPASPPGSASGSAILAARRSGTSKGRRSGEIPPPGSDAPARARRSAQEKSEKKSRTLARFITDGPGEPLVKLGEDGHLPELSLHEARSGERPQSGVKQSNPVILLVALGLSFGMTILMLFMDVGNFATSEELKAQARREIVEYYVAEGETLKPYQEHLRDARLARSRGDFEKERKEFQKVLALLRSEAKDYKYMGLTGRLEYDPASDNKKSDKRLEELIGILLSE